MTSTLLGPLSVSTAVYGSGAGRSGRRSTRAATSTPRTSPATSAEQHADEVHSTDCRWPARYAIVPREGRRGDVHPPYGGGSRSRA